MTPDVKVNLLKRAKAVIDTGVPEMSDSMIQVDVDRYHNPDRFEGECDVFRQFPQPVAAVSDLSDPGDWLTTTSIGRPILITRGMSGELNAFLNVCRHRGMPVAPLNEKGKDRVRFSCPYHAWQYSNNGSLIAIRRQEGFPEAQKETLGLQPLAVAERAGLIWVIPDAERRNENVSDHLGPLADEIEALGFGEYQGFGTRDFDIGANWKIVTDGSLEDYHFKVLHSVTSGVFFEDTAQIIDEFDLNLRMFLPKRMFDDVTEQDLERCQIREFGNILYYFFPGTWFLVQQDHAMISFVEPMAPDLTKMNEIALIPPNARHDGDDPSDHWQINVDLFRRTLDEDYVIAPDIQTALKSGANAHFVFGKFEQAPAFFHANLDSLLSRLSSNLTNPSS